MNQALPLRVGHVGDGLALGDVANLFIVIWRGPVTRPRFNIQRDGLREAVKRHSEGAGMLCVIEPTATPPDDELRRASADMIRELQAQLRCVACVVEGTGFVHALGRSALSGMALLLGRRSVPVSVFATVGAAATWMAPHVSIHDSRWVSDAVESLRASLEPWEAPRSRR